MALIELDDIYNPPGTPQFHTERRSHGGPLVKHRPMTLKRVLNALFLRECVVPAADRLYYSEAQTFLERVQEKNEK